MMNSTHDMQATTAAACSRLDRGVAVSGGVYANGRNMAIFGAATGGFWTLEPKTTKHHHSQRERRT